MAKDSFGIGDSVQIQLEEALERLEQSPFHNLPDANSKPETDKRDSRSSAAPDNETGG